MPGSFPSICSGHNKGISPIHLRSTCFGIGDQEADLKTNPESVIASPMTAESRASNSIQTSQHIAKKTFAEPELSSPVDVLDATTYFQSVDSGVTNP